MFISITEEIVAKISLILNDSSNNFTDRDAEDRSSKEFKRKISRTRFD